jgi:hypothetical protein
MDGNHPGTVLVLTCVGMVAIFTCAGATISVPELPSLAIMFKGIASGCVFGAFFAVLTIAVIAVRAMARHKLQSPNKH